jgi:hypothetical protein
VSSAESSQHPREVRAFFVLAMKLVSKWSQEVRPAERRRARKRAKLISMAIGGWNEK